MSVINREVVLTHDCLSVTAEDLQLRLPPHMLAEPIAYDDGEWEQVLDGAQRELAHAGLFADGVPTDSIVATLQVLCGGTAEFYGLVTTTRHRYYLHVAAHGTQAVLATLANGNVLLRPAKPDMLVSELLAELPEANPAAGRSMSASQHEMNPSAGNGSIYNNTNPSGDARRLLALFDKPRYASGHLGTAVRVGLDNRRVTSTEPVSFFDVDDGRWFSYATNNSGTWHCAATPGRTDTIANKLRELHHGLLAEQR